MSSSPGTSAGVSASATEAFNTTAIARSYRRGGQLSTSPSEHWPAYTLFPKIRGALKGNTRALDKITREELINLPLVYERSHQIRGNSRENLEKWIEKNRDTEPFGSWIAELNGTHPDFFNTGAIDAEKGFVPRMAGLIQQAEEEQNQSLPQEMEQPQDHQMEDCVPSEAQDYDLLAGESASESANVPVNESQANAAAVDAEILDASPRLFPDWAIESLPKLAGQTRLAYYASVFYAYRDALENMRLVNEEQAATCEDHHEKAWLIHQAALQGDLVTRLEAEARLAELTAEWDEINEPS